MTLTEGKGLVTSSYTGSSRVLLLDNSKAAFVCALLLLSIKAITVMKTTVLAIKAVAKKAVVIMYAAAVLVSKLCMPIVSVVSE